MAPTKSESGSTFDNDGRKRVPKACDRCRLKKIKCDGVVPCVRCKADDTVCHFGTRRKSIDRPISAGYVDQLELQQKILIKALKETWRVYGPAESPFSPGEDASIHAIVKSLGVLKDAPGYQPITADFKFNENLSASRTFSVKTGPCSPASEMGREMSEPAISSCVSPMDTTGSFDSHSTTSPPSRQNSPASAGTSATSLSANSDCCGSFGASTQSQSSSNGRRVVRPSYCPLPPRPNYIPTVPSQVDWNMPEGFTYPIQTASINSNWLNDDSNWTNAGMGTIPMASNFDDGMEGLAQLADETWSAWINDHPEYATSPSEFTVWLSLLSDRR